MFNRSLAMQSLSEQTLAIQEPFLQPRDARSQDLQQAPAVHALPLEILVVIASFMDYKTFKRTFMDHLETRSVFFWKRLRSPATGGVLEAIIKIEREVMIRSRLRELTAMPLFPVLRDSPLNVRQIIAEDDTLFERIQQAEYLSLKPRCTALCLIIREYTALALGLFFLDMATVFLAACIFDADDATLQACRHWVVNDAGDRICDAPIYSLFDAAECVSAMWCVLVLDAIAWLSVVFCLPSRLRETVNQVCIEQVVVVDGIVEQARQRLTENTTRTSVTIHVAEAGALVHARRAPSLH